MEAHRKNLIIGVNSFLGRSLVDKLLKRGEKVYGVYHKNTDNLNPEIENLPHEKLESLTNDFDYVYLLSAYIPKVDSEIVSDKLLDVNVHLAKSITKHFSNAKVIYSSSVSVYKNCSEIIDEQSETGPATGYGKSKLLAEQFVKQHRFYAIVRISSMYGPAMKLQTFLPIIIKNAIDSDTITLYGDGLREQNYIYVDDVADYLIAAANYNKNELFLATGEKSISNLNVAKKVSLQTNMAEIKFKNTDDSPSHHYNNNRSKRLLGIDSETSLNKGIKKLVTWIKK